MTSAALLYDAWRGGIAQNVLGLSYVCVWAMPWLYACSANPASLYGKSEAMPPCRPHILANEC